MKLFSFRNLAASATWLTVPTKRYRSAMACFAALSTDPTQHLRNNDAAHTSQQARFGAPRGGHRFGLR